MFGCFRFLGFFNFGFSGFRVFGFLGFRVFGNWGFGIWVFVFLGLFLGISFGGFGDQVINWRVAGRGSQVTGYGLREEGVWDLGQGCRV